MKVQPRILIVDDDSNSRDLLALVLGKEGCDIVTTGTVEGALEKANNGPFNAGLLDIELPDGKGVELLAPLKTRHPQMELIMVTGYASTETAMQALNAGATAYITKPLNMDEVLAEVRKILEKQQLVAEKTQAEEQIRHVNAVLDAIRSVNRLIVREPDRDRLMRRACESLIETRGYLSAWIALRNDRGEISQFVSAGVTEQATDMAGAFDKGGWPPCARHALDQSKALVLEKSEAACASCPLVEARGPHSGLATPLAHAGKVYGVLIVTTTVDFASEQELSLFGEVADDIALALHSMEMEEQSEQATRALRISEERYRGLFENSPTPLWEEDFSDVKARLEELQRNGVDDLRSYFTAHSEGVLECVSEVGILDVNQAALRLHGAESKEELLSSLHTVFTEGSYAAFAEELALIAAGKRQFDLEFVTRTLDGERRDVIVRWSAMPGHEETLSKVVVAAIDITERKRAEEKVKRLARFPSENPNPVLRIAEDGSILYANQASAPLLEAWDCQPGDALPNDWRSFSLRVLRSGQGGEAEVQVRNRTLSLSVAPMSEAGYVNVYGLDVTERKRAQEALARQSEELARINTELEKQTVQLEWLAAIQAALSQASNAEEILTTVAMGIDVDQPPTRISLAYLETDEDGRPTHRRSVAIWEDGLVVPDHPDLQQLQEVDSSPISALWLETPDEPVFISNVETDPRVDERMLEFADVSGFQSAILVPLRSSGRWQGVVKYLWSETHTFSREERFYVQQLFESLAAVVASRRAHLAHQESEARYRDLFNSASDATFIYDLTGKLLAANDVACERLGYNRDELLRMTIEDIDAPEQAPQVVERIEDLRRRERLVFETFQVRADGSKIPVEVSSRLIDYRGQQAVLSDSRDISERLEMEEQLQRNERLAAVGQLAGGIAHDFRNFLTTIILYAGMPSRKVGLDPQIENALEVITSEAQQASDLVQQILDFSGRSAMQTQPVDLVEFIEEGADILQQTIPENIRVTLAIGSSAAAVEADPTRIQQVLMNLALNARDAMPEGGDLEIALSTTTIPPSGDPPVPGMEPGDWVCLTVSDTGTGMTEKVKDRIFEPFFTTKAPGKGTGLGLAQVYGIVQQHHGAIDVETELGVGSSFHVYLPVHVEEQTKEEEKDSSTPRGNGEMILLVEDQENLREAGREMLTALDYRVLTAANGNEALETLQGIMVDLVITDIVMPRMGGKALMRKLMKMYPDLPALAVTGYTMDEEMENLTKVVGFTGVLHKPFDAPALAQAVRQALDE